MNESFAELEGLIIENLQLANSLKNVVIVKELEKHDLLKSITLGIIEILDTFDRIDENMVGKGLDKNEEVNKTMTRYKAVQKKMLNLLQKNGVSKIVFPNNKVIVGWCEVVDTESDINRQNDEIVTIVRTGFIRGNELIRPSQVIVIKN